MWRTQQPGQYAGYVLSPEEYSTASCVIEAVTDDFEAFNFNHDCALVFQSIGKYDVCPTGTYKIMLATGDGKGYHWYRQNPDGYWSHKYGGHRPISNLDESFRPITDPEAANRGEFTDLEVYFFAVTPWNRYKTS